MKPFLSYIGSKQKFMKKLVPLFPEEINNYYEPFVGGGSVLFYLNEHYDINKNYINDLDNDVINVYKMIKDKQTKLIKYLDILNKKKSKKNFEKLVDIFNNNKSDKILLAAIYIFFTKRTFNGWIRKNNDNTIKSYYSKNHSYKNI